MIGEPKIRNRFGIVLFVFMVSAWLQTGCAARKTQIRPPEIESPAIRTAEEVVEVLAKNYGNVASLKASGKIKTIFIPEDQWRQVAFALAAERPDKTRLRAYRTLTPTLFEFISNSRECWLYIPPERTAYLSQDCGNLRVEGNRIPLSARAIVAAIFVKPDFEALSSPPKVILQEDGSFHITAMDGERTKRELTVDPDTGYVTRQLIIGPNGMVEYDIIYEEQAFEEGVVFPTAIEVIAPRAQAVVSMQIDEVKLDPDISVDMFDFSPPEDVIIYPSVGLETPLQ